MIVGMLCQRAYSIRTRIKTIVVKFKCYENTVREHIPLEQGLRPNAKIVCGFVVVLSESIFH